MTLDTIDCRILALLQKEGRISNQLLAERVALSPSACLRRLRALEDGGVILGYQAVIDPARPGSGWALKPWCMYRWISRNPAGMKPLWPAWRNGPKCMKPASSPAPAIMCCKSAPAIWLRFQTLWWINSTGCMAYAKSARTSSCAKSKRRGSPQPQIR